MSYRYLIVLLISLINICPKMCDPKPSPYNNDNHGNHDGHDDHNDNDNNHGEQQSFVPKTYVVNTPYGQQVVTQQLGPDGSYFIHSSGPGYQGSSYQQGVYNGKDGNFHYNSMGSASANQYSAQSGNGMQMGSYQGQAMGGDGSGMGMMMGHGVMPMKPFKFRPIKMAPMKFPEFKWWPSIFDTHHDDDDH